MAEPETTRRDDDPAKSILLVPKRISRLASATYRERLLKRFRLQMREVPEVLSVELFNRGVTKRDYKSDMDEEPGDTFHFPRYWLRAELPGEGVITIFIREDSPEDEAKWPGGHMRRILDIDIGVNIVGSFERKSDISTLSDQWAARVEWGINQDRSVSGLAQDVRVVSEFSIIPDTGEKKREKGHDLIVRSEIVYDQPFGDYYNYKR